MVKARSAQSVLLEMLSAVPDGLAVAALIGAGEVLGISSNGVRVALSRLKRQRLIVGGGRGFYRLGPAVLAVQRVVAGWREVEQQVGSWDGSWVAVHSAAVPKSERRATRSRGRALRLLGFEALADGLHVRPHNLCRTVDETRARLRELGLDCRELVFRIDDLSAEAGGRAARLWDDARLDDAYRDMTKRLAAAERTLQNVSVAQAARDAFVLGSEGIRRIVADPLLPAPIVDVEARAKFFAAMRRFDTFGREKWRRVLAEEMRDVA